MSSYQRLTMTLSEDTTTFLSRSNIGNGDQFTDLRGLIDYLKGIPSQHPASFSLLTGAAYGTATLTVSSTGSANDETCSICNVTFTAKTSGATGNQFNISTTAATQASNMATAFNASADLAGIVTAEAVGAVVTLTSVAPGTIGNGLQISESLTNVALSAFVTEDTGVDGTTYSFDLS